MIIIVTGTPGTGKSTIAKAVAKRLQCTYLDVNTVIDSYRLKTGYDKKRQAAIIDEKKLCRVLVSFIKKEKNLVIDSHLVADLPAAHVDVCLVTKTDIHVLKERLEARGYSQAKVRENLDAEIFEVCHIEAREKKHNIIVVDTTQTSVDDAVDKVLNAIRAHKR